MFGDEIDSVRIRAITCFGIMSQQVGELIELKEEHLQVALVALEDANFDVRKAVHTLLSITHVLNATCLHATIRALLANMSKYPQDLPSVYKCVKHLALNHALMLEFLVEELLRLERFMLTIEPKIEDDFCMEYT